MGNTVAPTMRSPRAWTRSTISVMPAITWLAGEGGHAPSPPRSLVPSRRSTSVTPGTLSTSCSRRTGAGTAALVCRVVRVGLPADGIAGDPRVDDRLLLLGFEHPDSLAEQVGPAIAAQVHLIPVGDRIAQRHDGTAYIGLHVDEVEPEQLPGMPPRGPVIGED